MLIPGDAKAIAIGSFRTFGGMKTLNHQGVFKVKEQVVHGGRPAHISHPGVYMDMEKESENKIKTQEWRKNTFFVIVPTTHYQEIFFLNNQPDWILAKLNATLPENKELTKFSRSYLWALQNPNLTACISQMETEEQLLDNLQAVGIAAKM